MNKIFNLLQIKKLIALILTIVFSILALRGEVGSTEFISVFSMIVAFYFGQSSARQAINESKGE